jgi:hypothetical protein
MQSKILRIVSFVIMIGFAVPASSAMIVPATSQTNNNSKTEDPKVQQLLQRLEEISSMSKSEMTTREKKDLRKEVRDIKKEMKKVNRGVYLSVGAIIIIILLLILLL